MLDTHKEMNHIKMDTQKKKKRGENMNYSYINKYIMGEFSQGKGNRFKYRYIA